MRSTDITVFYSTLRLQAMERTLKDKGQSVSSAVEAMLDELYQKTVPLRERNEIEAQIRQEEAQVAADAEAARRFGVYHIWEKDEDAFFISETHNDLYMAACECRKYLQDGKAFPLAEYFKHKQTVSMYDNMKCASHIGHDPRITMVIDLDVDQGLCVVKSQGDDGWKQYRMKDLSTAIYRATRKEGLRFADRLERFNGYLADKDMGIVLPDYSVQEQAGKTAQERIEAFDRSNTPFYLVDYEDGKYGLILPLTFLKPPFPDYGQYAFDAYAESMGEEPWKEGMFAYGSGYDWEHVFKKAFADDPLLQEVRFDSEAGSFCCRSENLSALEQLGSRFKALCENKQVFGKLVSEALAEAEQAQQMRQLQWGGM